MKALFTIEAGGAKLPSAPDSMPSPAANAEEWLAWLRKTDPERAADVEAQIRDVERRNAVAETEPMLETVGKMFDIYVKLRAAQPKIAEMLRDLDLPPETTITIESGGDDG